MADTDFRPGERKDQDWMYRLFRETMRDHIDKAWGWDELLQREGFLASLPVQEFQVLLVDDVPTGCYYLKEKSEHLQLEMIMVDPARQRQGLGRCMMQRIQTRSAGAGKPVRLSVLKTNPAVKFHLALGFTARSEDPHSMKMSWHHDDRGDSTSGQAPLGPT